MKKFLSIVLFLICIVLTGFSQVGVNPSDSFYEQLKIWEIQGIVKDLPPLRPYPSKVVKEILVSVMNSEDMMAASKAQELYNHIFGKKINADVSVDGKIKLSDFENAKQGLCLFGITGDLIFFDNISTSYDLKIASTLNHDSNILPIFSALPFTFRDSTTIGSIENFLEMNGSVAFTSSKFYVQAGICNNDFGSFYQDSIVLNANAQHTANFTFVLNPGSWSYTHGLFVLGASTNAGYNVYPNKFLMLHSINVAIFDWLSTSFYESLVYGDRFDLSYLIPMPFMIAQGITGFDDNLIMGVTFDVKPFADFIWSTNIFIDDISLDDIFKFDFDTKIRGALQTGLQYSPKKLPFGSLFELDYTLVTPYMYTHKQNIYSPYDGSFVIGGSDAINYQAYTNAGKPLGSQLAPNSDRISLSAKFEPITNLQCNIFGNFIRHANVNESLTVKEAIDYLNAPNGYFLTDGSIYNHPHVAYKEDGKIIYDYIDSAKNRLMFMSQDTKMYVVQTGVGLTYAFPKFKWGQVSVELGYVFEYIKNWGVQNNMFNGLSSDWQDSATEADVITSLENWKEQLIDVINNYLSVSIKYQY